MQLLIVIPQQPQTTGNFVTARRFARQLRLRGWGVALVETPPETPGPIRSALQSHRPDVVLLLHAYRCGRPWLLAEAPGEIPFAVLLTGTDQNRDKQLPERAAVIAQIEERAAAVIVQNPLLFNQLQEHPGLQNLRLVPPGAELGTQPFALRQTLKLSPQEPVWLHPASIREVKGNLELLQLCDPLVERQPRLRLVFCGPALENDYAARFFAALAERPWASYVGEIPASAMPAAMTEADLILNNSLSEGVANALVEAAKIGLPIFARDIPGNRAVLRHGENGLIYASREEFLRQGERLLTDPALRQQLSQPDPQRWSAAREGEELEKVLNSLLGERKAS